MASQTDGEKIAAAIVADLSDANHPVWKQNHPGLAGGFNATIKAEMLARLAQVIDANLKS